LLVVGVAHEQRWTLDVDGFAELSMGKHIPKFAEFLSLLIPPKRGGCNAETDVH
jgi:hypothetical protein